jgi:hypothetical protein
MDTATLAARASWVARLDSRRLDSTTAGADNMTRLCTTPACPRNRSRLP